MDIKSQVLDDEDSNNITVGSLVTVLITLTRQTMAEVFEKEQSTCSAEEQPAEDGQGDANKVKNRGWQQKNKGTKKTSKSKKKKLLKKKPVPAPLQQTKQQKQKQANGVVGSEVVKEEEEDASDKGSESYEDDTNRDSLSDKDEGSDRDSDREPDEKQSKDDEAVSGRSQEHVVSLLWGCRKKPMCSKCAICHQENSSLPFVKVPIGFKVENTIFCE
uniref:Uncharacterized protein n=1 Tax=Sphaerodactylus townsendi TaxID=933632 RepID=A0ACB8GDY2_9SAUR